MKEAAADTQKKILVVDDEYSIREALIMFFEKKGFFVKQASNGADAAFLAEKEDFDVIISDIRMDKMDGVALVKLLKLNNKKVPVIFMTAYPELQNAIDAIRNGVVEYIIKPFDMKDVAEKVDSAIKTKRESTDEHYNKMYKEQKRNFLNLLSHELRTPLTPVAGYITLLMKKEFGEIPPRQLDVIRNIAKNSKRLKDLTDDLIMLYSLEEAGEPLCVRKHRVMEIIEKSVDSLQEQLKQKRQELSIKIFDDIGEISCDIKKIIRVIFHLVDNASKFGPVKAAIEISIRKFIYNENEFIKVSVYDTGNPIAGMDRREIFRQFHNVAKYGDDFETSKSAKGLGMGLTLTKAIVEAHHGMVWIEQSKTDDNGNIFSFILPAE